MILRNTIVGFYSKSKIIDGSVKSTYPEWLWVASELQSFFFNNSDSEWFGCKHSNLLADLACSAVYFEEFSSYTKPWRCEMNLLMFLDPITAMFKDWPMTMLYRGDMVQVLSSVYPINVFIDFAHQWENITYNYISTMRHQITPFQMFNNVFSRSLIKPLFVEMPVGTVFETKSQIETLGARIRDVFVIRSKIVFGEAVFEKVPYRPDSTVMRITEQAYFPEGEQIIWGNVAQTFSSSLSEQGVDRHMAMCENELTRFKSHSVKPFRGEDDERMFHAFAYVLQSIMGNFTYNLLKSNGNKCSNGAIVTDINGMLRRSVIRGVDMYWILRGTAMTSWNIGLSVNISLNNLRFVACGERGISEFAFHELLVAYQLEAWIGIVTAVVVLSYAFKLLWSPVPHPRHLLALIKVLLEQGDPFLASVAQIQRLRWMIGTFMLIGTVLSNAYKNTNVYNMILPREVLLYEHLDQLSQKNISVYTRTVDFDIVYLWQKNKKGFQEFYKPYKYVKYDFKNHSASLSGIKAYSEIKTRFDFTSKFQIWMNKPARSYWFHGNDEEDMTELQMDLVKQSRLHPKIPYLIGYFAQTLSPFYQINYRRAVEYFDDGDKKYDGVFQKWFYELEEQVLEDELLVCNKTAVLLPQFKARSFARKLLKQKASLPVSISKESYSPFYIHAIVRGFVPPYMLRNIQGIQQAGVLEWWVKYIDSSEKVPISQQKPIEAPKITGSILVVFILLICGCSIGFLVFIIEVRCWIWRFAKSTLNILIAAIAFKYKYIRSKFLCWI